MAWADMGFTRPLRRVFLGGCFFGIVGVAGSWRSDDDDAGEQPRRLLFCSVCGVHLVARVALFPHHGHAP
jgi:hypothetical protein